jgi:hypothetical protein
MVDCYGRQSSVSLICKHCLGLVCISFQFCIIFPFANRYSDYFNVTPVSG